MIILLTKFKVKRTDTRTTPMMSKELNKEGGILSLFLTFSTIRALILSSNFNPFRANASVYFNAFQCSVTFLYPRSDFLTFSGSRENATEYWKALT